MERFIYDNPLMALHSLHIGSKILWRCYQGGMMAKGEYISRVG
jgi:hypothetical protein